ncbi:phospholipase A2 [[Actinomadura] parvosata]|uniref:phospholipase A2 n=1 Tax=[Actinomadura] parvosata TaxID=1955412 RepID=UPI0016440F39
MANVQYKIDSGDWIDLATTGAAVTAKLSFPAGAHTISARTRDSAGNASDTTAYTFYAGKGAALLAPAHGERPARRTALLAQGSSTDTGVRYQYRQGETDTWHDVPLTDVRSKADGSTPSAWPVPVTKGATPELVWNIADSIRDDGPLDVRAVFIEGTTSTASPHNTIVLDRVAGAAPRLPISLGNVNVLTGDFTLNAADATMFGMSVTRFASSRRPQLGTANPGQAAIFGPQWSFGSDLESTATTWTSIQAISPGLVVLKDNEGGQTGFTATANGGWKPEPGAEKLALTKTADGGFLLTDTSGVTSTFAAMGGSTTSWQLAGTARAADDSPSVLLVSEAVTVSGKTLARPKYLIARTSAVSNDTCKAAPATKGCRVLEYLYATSTTATAAQFGTFAGQVDGIRLWATDPGAGSATATTLASYAYDPNGRLRQVWDPRISPALRTQYDYDDAGRLQKLSLPGSLPWTFAYAKAGGSAVAGEGMLLSAEQPALRPGSKTQTDGTATYSLVYEVPLTGAAAPYAMGRTDVAAWAQADAPTDATALFPPDAIPRGHTGIELTANDYKRATVVYTDASGRWVNVVQPGGHAETVEYDSFGNSVRELTAANRELALGKGPDAQARLESLDLAELSTAERAQLLSSTHLYSDDGRREIDSYAPLRLTTVTTGLKATATLPAVPDGTEIPGRQHIHQEYDTGRPTDGSAAISNVITKTTTGMQVPGYPETDRRSQSSSYDWSKGMPVGQTEDPGGLNLTRTTTYNAAGRAVQAATPLSDGDDAGTTVVRHWTASGTGACAGRPEWADLTCSVSPKDKITDTNGNPDEDLTVSTEYDRHGQPAKITETANGATRVTSISYDQAGRAIRSVVTGGPGVPVQASTTTYDPVTGKPATITSDDGSKVSYDYDALGRKVTFTDADAATTTTEYDALERVLRTVSSAPSTTTYEYDTSIEPRGLATKMTDSAAGVFTQVYDGGGNVIQQTLPGGVTMRQTLGPDEEPYSRAYTMQGAAEPFFTSTGSTSVHEEVTERTGLSRVRQKFDPAGRLVESLAEKQDGSTDCVLHTYTYNANGSRKSEASATSSSGTACPTTTATPVTHAYDSAGRIVDPGYAYDALGRLTATPDGLASAYFANDELQQQTAGGLRQTWTLDPQGQHRRAVVESNATGTWQSTATMLSHYDGEDVVWSVDGAGGVTRTVLSPVEDLNGIATVRPDGSVSLELDEVTDDGEIEYITSSGELIVHDMSDAAMTSVPAQIVAGEEAISPAQLLAQCLGCEATLLDDAEAPTTAETVTPLYSRSGSRASATDYWLFSVSLWAFKDYKNWGSNSCRRKDLVWKDDGCSVPKVLGGIAVKHYKKQFSWPCQRHDFGYRNYRKQRRNTSESRRHRIDKRFKNDMYKYICKPKNWFSERACKGAAWSFYQSVDKFGKSAFYKRW